MTYKNVLDDLIDILSRHRMIVTWGYGNLSDLVTPFKKPTQLIVILVKSII